MTNALSGVLIVQQRSLAPALPPPVVFLSRKNGRTSLAIKDGNHPAHAHIPSTTNRPDWPADALCKCPCRLGQVCDNKHHNHRQRSMRHSRLTLLTLIVLRLTTAIDPLGFKSATITETGEIAIFEWYQQPIANRSQATEFCESYGSSIPEIRELRYFFKSLTLQNGSIFYLNDVMETTVDSPNEAIGERMCITVESRPGRPVSDYDLGTNQTIPNRFCICSFSSVKQAQ